MLTVYTVTRHELWVERWFGLRRTSYSLLPGTPWQQQGQSVDKLHHTWFLPKRLHNYQCLYIHTIKGKTVKTDSRYVKNLKELTAAVKRAVSKRG